MSNQTKWRASLILNIVLTGALLYTLFHYNAFSSLQNKISDEEVTTSSPYYAARNDVFSTTTGPPGGAIFIGDSLTDMNEWEEAFPGKNIKNRGIYGDTTQGVLKRLHSVISQEPEKIFIMIGINDLAEKTDTGRILKNYQTIITSLNEELPDTEIYIQSLLPNHEELNTKASIDNDEIIQINDHLQNLAQEHDAAYIDLYSDFETENGQLAKNYTVDGVHLNGEGYKVWEEKISKYLD
jgi:lysophospholipase L1-like esterase